MPGEDDDLSARANARLGSVLRGKYRLERVLGVGGFATVYAATHRNKDRVAVKILHRELAIERGLRDRFLREGYAANSVEHPGTVRVLDDDLAEDGSVFLVMDLLDGETLDARWERSGRRLTVAEVIALMVQLLDVLTAAHAKKITHRDLKPENLFLARDGKLKILDFGVARLREASPTQTKSGAVFGTPAFMPPEQALGRVKEVDALSDLWAVGATAFTLLSGRYVHEGQTAEEMLICAATKPAPLLRTVAPHVPEAVAAVFDRALRFEKRARWQSAKEMREALEVARGSPTATPDDWSDDAATRLAPAPQMTMAGAHAATADMPTLPVATIGGVTSNTRSREWRVRRTLVAGGVGGGLFLLLIVTVLALIAINARRDHASEATTAASLPPSVASSAVATIEPAASTTAPSVASSDSVAPPATTVTASPSTTAATVRASSTASARTAPPPPPNPYCEPPFEMVNGVKRWKRGCL